MLNRFKPIVWYCKRLTEGDEGYENDGVDRFSAPIQRFLNYRYLSSELALASGGEINSGILTARQLRGHPDKYYEGDLLYVDKEPENSFDPIEPGANYRITSVMPNHNIMTILAEKKI